MLKLIAVGQSICHPEGLTIQRPSGSGDWLFLLFHSRACVTLRAGETEAEPGSAVLFRKSSPQYYRSLGGPYINSYLHFDLTGADDLADRWMPLSDTLLRPADPEALQTLLGIIQREQLTPSPRQAEVLDLLMRTLLLKVADAPEEASLPHASALLALRAELYNEPGQWQSVAQMAARVRLSIPHFQQLYRQRFHVSCYEDMLRARTQAARHYLSHTNLPVKEIAALCGYENDVCFMRRFKQRTGQTPSAWRHASEGGSHADA